MIQVSLLSVSASVSVCLHRYREQPRGNDEDEPRGGAPEVASAGDRYGGSIWWIYARGDIGAIGAIGEI